MPTRTTYERARAAPRAAAHAATHAATHAAAQAAAHRCVRILELVADLRGSVERIEGGDDADADSSDHVKNTVNLDLATASPVVLLHSHFQGEVWGLAVHPTDPDVVATAGDDCTIRIWSLSTHTLLGCMTTKAPIRSLAWHPRGSILAAGMFRENKGGHGAKGSSKRQGKKRASSSSNTRGKKGMFTTPPANSEDSVIFFTYGRKNRKEAVLQELVRFCDTKAWVSDV